MRGIKGDSVVAWEDVYIMTGEVIAINNTRGMVVVSHDDGYSVIELLGGYSIDVGDELKGRLDSEGSEVILNLSENEKMDVCVQGAWGDFAIAKEHAFL